MFPFVFVFSVFFFFKQKTAYEMRISDWSSDVCSSDLRPGIRAPASRHGRSCAQKRRPETSPRHRPTGRSASSLTSHTIHSRNGAGRQAAQTFELAGLGAFSGSRSTHSINRRSEEHTSELQSLMRISYAVSCLK